MGVPSKIRDEEFAVMETRELEERGHEPYPLTGDELKPLCQTCTRYYSVGIAWPCVHTPAADRSRS